MPLPRQHGYKAKSLQHISSPHSAGFLSHQVYFIRLVSGRASEALEFHSGSQGELTRGEAHEVLSNLPTVLARLTEVVGLGLVVDRP